MVWSSLSYACHRFRMPELEVFPANWADLAAEVTWETALLVLHLHVPRLKHMLVGRARSWGSWISPIASHCQVVILTGRNKNEIFQEMSEEDQIVTKDSWVSWRVVLAYSCFQCYIHADHVHGNRQPWWQWWQRRGGAGPRRWRRCWWNRGWCWWKRWRSDDEEEEEVDKEEGLWW